MLVCILVCVLTTNKQVLKAISMWDKFLSYSTTLKFHLMLSENLQTPMKEKSGNLQHEASECERLHELKISFMLFHKHLPYIHVTGFTQPDTVKN